MTVPVMGADRSLRRETLHALLACSQGLGQLMAMWLLG